MSSIAEADRMGQFRLRRICFPRLAFAAVLFAAAAYFVMPADLVPDVVVGLGFTDDATVLATALSVVGAHVKERHRAMARRLLRLPEPLGDKA